jgi:hypothetical protein
MSSIHDLAQALQDSRIGDGIAESRHLFPILEGTHLLSLSFSVGLILLTDLRLIGVFWRHVPVTTVLHQLRPFILSGFAVLFISGGLTFCSEAATIMASPVWTVKMILVALGGLNALYFEFVIAKRPEVVENHPVLPRSVKYAGLASLTIWTLVIICGRLLAYIPRWNS